MTAAVSELEEGEEEEEDEEEAATVPAEQKQDRVLVRLETCGLMVQWCYKLKV